MADYFYRTTAEAFVALKQFLQANLMDGTVASGTVDCTVSYGGFGTPLYYNLTSPLPSSPDRFYFAEVTVGRPIPVSLLSREQGLNSAIVVSFADPGPGYYTFRDWAIFLRSILVSTYYNACGASPIFLGEYDANIGGGGIAAIWLGDLYLTENDINQSIALSVNTHYLVGNFPLTSPVNLVYPTTSNVALPGAPQVVINQAPPLDTDVSINNGQAILSVISRTITMLP